MRPSKLMSSKLWIGSSKIAASRGERNTPKFKAKNVHTARAFICELERTTPGASHSTSDSGSLIRKPDRRDRMLLLVAMAHALMTLLGAASEATGMDAYLKANTVKRRTHSLFRQGLLWYQAIPNMRDDWLNTLMTSFDGIVREHAVFQEVFGVL